MFLARVCVSEIFTWQTGFTGNETSMVNLLLQTLTAKTP